MKRHLLILIIGFILASGQSYTQNWVPVGGASAYTYPNNREIIEFEGDMYAVGNSYNQGTSMHIPQVLKLVGEDWEEVGSGFLNAYGAVVNAITVYNSELYIGGNFIMDNGSNPLFYYVAKWDTVSDLWVPVGDGTGSGGGVKELTVFNDTLYAGGDFDDLGAGGTNNIAAFGGTSWEPVGSGISTASSSGDYDQITSMVVYDNELIVGGKFTTAGGIQLHNIASWDGSGWAYLKGDPVQGGGGVGGGLNGIVDIMALEVFDGDLYIGGIFSSNYSFTYLSSPTFVPNHLVVWDGISFSAPTKATPSNNRINAMTVFNNRIYIGNENESNIYSWDGGINNWELEPDRDPLRQRVTCLYSNATDIFYGNYSYGVYKLMDPLPSFTPSNKVPCAGDTITFTDNSTGSNTITAWNWTFEGGTPDTSDLQNPKVVFNSQGNWDVALEVTSSDGSNSLTFVDMIVVNDTISITSDPADVSICSNVQAEFSVSVFTDSRPFTSQWQVDDGTGFVDLENGGTPHYVAGSTITTLKYTPSVDNGGYKFRYIGTRCNNSDTSDVATLTVNEAPVITEQPVAQAICDSGDASFPVTVTGPEPIVYQWEYRIANTISFAPLSDGAVYGGTDTDTLSITGVDNTLGQLYDSDNIDGNVMALYRLVATANGCTVYSSYAYLNIHDVPTVTAEPADITVCNTGAGITQHFSVTSSLTPGGFNYQWQVDSGSGFVDVPAEDTIYSGINYYRLTLTKADSGYSDNLYRCEIGACETPVYSEAATLVIDTKPVDTLLYPSTTRICEGSDAEISVSASPGEYTSYQWQDQYGTDIVNNSIFFGAGTSTLYISDATTTLNLNRFKCEMSNGVCSASSKTFTLYVYGTPSISGAPPDRTACDSGASVTFNASTSGFQSTVNSYQWQEDFTDLGFYTDISDTAKFSGFNDRILTVKIPTYSMNGNTYRLKLNGCVKEIVGDSARLTVKAKPMVIVSPLSQTICPNTSVTFSVKAFGTDLKYNWYRDDGSGYSMVKTTTDTFYTFNGLESYNGYKYKCEVDNGSPCYYTAESYEATLTIQSAKLGTQEFEGGKVKFLGNILPASVDSFYWRFGDGVVEGGILNPEHVYPYNNNYNACLVVENECGVTQSCVYVYVNAVGVEDQSQQAQMGIWPNPVTEVLNIESIRISDRIEVFDLSGRKVYEMKAKADRVELNVSDFRKGFYILRVTNKDSVDEFRFEKL